MSESNAAGRFRATIAYDGAAFHGSQLQPDVRTVQGEVEAALSRLRDETVRIDLAGRTDTGVHASAQEIAFAAPGWNARELERALGAVLPDDIALVRLGAAGPDFHPRFDATGRRYEYIVSPAPGAAAPFLRSRAWPVGESVNWDRLGALAQQVPGERSFGGFAKSGQPERGTRCRVERAAWGAGPGDLLRFLIVADRFLHRMVRYLVGTMVEVATGRRPASDLRDAIEERTPSRPVFPAPPGGLYLTGVRYGETWNAPGGIPWLGGRGGNAPESGENEGGEPEAEPGAEKA